MTWQQVPLICSAIEVPGTDSNLLKRTSSFHTSHTSVTKHALFDLQIDDCFLHGSYCLHFMHKKRSLYSSWPFSRNLYFSEVLKGGCLSFKRNNTSQFNSLKVSLSHVQVLVQISHSVLFHRGRGLGTGAAILTRKKFLHNFTYIYLYAKLDILETCVPF